MEVKPSLDKPSLKFYGISANHGITSFKMKVIGVGFNAALFVNFSVNNCAEFILGNIKNTFAFSQRA